MILKRKICVKTRQRVKSSPHKSCSLRLHMYAKWAGFNLWSLPQLLDLSFFRLQTNPQLIWSPANPRPLNVNQTLLHHACLLWSRYFIFRLQLTDNLTNLQAVPAAPQLLIYPQVEKAEFYPYRKLRPGGLHPVCCISTFTNVSLGFQWEVALPHHLCFFAVITPWCNTKN